MQRFVGLLFLMIALPASAATLPKDYDPPAISMEDALKKAETCARVKAGDKSTYGTYYASGASFSPVAERVDGTLYGRHWRITITSSGIGEGALHFVHVYEDGRCEYFPGR